MSGRPSKEDSIELDARANGVYAEYCAGGITIQALSARLGISRDSVWRLLERARRNARGPERLESIDDIADKIDVQHRQIRIDQKRIEERLEGVLEENKLTIERQRREIAELKNKSKGWSEW